MALDTIGTNRWVRGTLVGLVTGLVVLFSTGVHSNGKHKMKTIPSLFESVQLGPTEESACSPQLGGWDYRGIKLNAPTRVIVTEEYILPLCGGWQFSEKFLNRFRNIFSMVVIVVTDKITFKSYSASLRKPGLEYKDKSKSIGTDEELENNTSSVNFNIDLYNYIPDLPQKPGKYQIYALVGEVKSNVVEVEIEVTKGASPGPKPPQPM